MQFNINKTYKVKYSVMANEALNSYAGGYEMKTIATNLTLQEAITIKEYNDKVNARDNIDYLIIVDVSIIDKSK